MANKLKGEVAFTAFETSFTLVMDFNALCSIDSELGIGINEIGARLAGSPATIRSVFRIGLETKHGAMTDLEAGRIIGEVGPARASELLAQAMTAAFPEAAEGTGSPQTGKKRTGTTAKP